MAKKESSFVNMFLTLLIITALAAVALAYVNSITSKRITEAKEGNKELAVKAVLPPFQKVETKEKEGIKLYNAYDNAHKLVGVAVESFTEKGFAGRIEVMVGFLPSGEIVNTSVLSHKETPGLGTKMQESPFKDQFNGKNPAKFKVSVKKDGGGIDAISGATISSRAFCDAVQHAYNIFSGKAETPATQSADATSGATSAATPQAAPAIEEALKEALPTFTKTELKKVTLKGEKEELTLYTAYNNNSVVGFAVASTTQKGYHGQIDILVGFLPNGEIYNTVVLKNNETQGFGSYISDPSFKDQFKGKNPKRFKLTVKDKGGDVDAISGATISSGAFCDAVQRAYNVCKQEGGLK